MSSPRTPTVHGAHSLIGASSMARLIACPASFALSQQVYAAGVNANSGGGGSSIYAATGTVAHSLAEEALTDGYDPASQLGETVQVDGHDVTVDADMVAAVNVYVAEVQRRTTGASWSALETRVCLDDYWPAGTGPAVSAFGTADLIAYHGTTLHLDVLDYKNGAGVFVDVTDNPQLMYYAAGALREVPGPVVTIDLTIVQPNVRGAEKVRTYRTTALDVLMWVDDVLKPTVVEAMTPGARIFAGKHCRFCPARASCPALSAVAQDLARRDFGPSPDEIVTLTETELGKVLRDADTVKVHIEALAEQAQASIQAGVPVPGWSLVPSRPVRTWGVKPDELITVLITECFPGGVAEGIDIDTTLFEPERLRTPAQVEKLVSPDVWAVLAPYVVSKSSGVRLIQDATDPAGDHPGRPAAQDEFA